MSLQRLAGILLIAAFTLLFVGAAANAPGLYQAENIEERLAILETYRIRWYVERAASVAYSLLTVVGFALLAYSMRASARGWIPLLGAAAFAVGTISGLVFLYLQTIDPRGGYSRAYPLPEDLAYWMWLAGSFLLGIGLVQAGPSPWLGYLTAAAAVALAMIFLLTGVGAVTPFILMFVQLVIGVVLLRAR